MNKRENGDLGFAHVDLPRAKRQGQPEVIFGEGKTAEQIVCIAQLLLEKKQNVLVTRVSSEKAKHIQKLNPSLEYMEYARIIRKWSFAPFLYPYEVVIVSAGTSDRWVVQECLISMQSFGLKVRSIEDVGVAGVHRLLRYQDELQKADLVVVVAGMEGALPSVVGGLVSCPVIAVPTSVGYGASFHGLSALLGMLSSCASGLTVVNIDNGFGAAFAAFRIVKKMYQHSKKRKNQKRQEAKS